MASEQVPPPTGGWNVEPDRALSPNGCLRSCSVAGAAFLLVALVAGTAFIILLGASLRDMYPHPGAPVVERIRAVAPSYVDDFKYQPIGPISDATGDWIEIFLFADVTHAQVMDLYCNIVTPAAAAELGREGLSVYKGVTWHPSKSVPLASGQYRYFDGGTVLTTPVCPAQ